VRRRLTRLRGPDEGPLHQDHARLGGMLVWIAFIAFPVVNAAIGPQHGVAKAAVIAGGAAFSGIYTWLVIIWVDPGRRVRPTVLVAVLLAIAVALTVAADPGWAFLFSYVAACSALVVPSPWGFASVLVVSALSVGAAVAGGTDVGSGVGYGASAVGVGLLLTLLRDLRTRNEELNAARAELARTAVAAERERFARDLHDLLGHSLSVIAIKAELTGRLIGSAPERAATEVAELEAVARTALSEVREAVSGYRRPTLDHELEGARVALAAAGIAARFEAATGPLSPEVEAVLAWTVREGATNVIRHSGARCCAVRVRADGAAAEVEVVDDGAGEGPRPGDGPGGGNGLAGLRERTAAVCGRLEAGALDGGGFRLAVSVPMVSEVIA
jgi:two-component system, NarL family, sensor histidine kinase DesK